MFNRSIQCVVLYEWLHKVINEAAPIPLVILFLYSSPRPGKSPPPASRDQNKKRTFSNVLVVFPLFFHFILQHTQRCLERFFFFSFSKIISQKKIKLIFFISYY